MLPERDSQTGKVRFHLNVIEVLYYNKTFFDIKRKAKLEGNKGLEAIAKMYTGKLGFNLSKQKGTRIVRYSADFYKYFIWLLV